jgi:hypothetical protein
VNVVPEGRINMYIIDRDTKVQASTIKLSLNDNDITSAATITPTAAGASIAYLSPTFLPGNMTNKITVVYSDNATPANVFTNTWSFITLSAPVIPAAFAKPLGTGQDRGFSARVIQTANTGNGTARAENQLAGQVQPIIGITYATVPIINWNQDQPGSIGNFGEDDPIPGVPGPTGSTDGLAAEVVAYLELSRGMYQFGVNSDDSFRVTAGRIPNVMPPTLAVPNLTVGSSTTNYVVIGEFNDGRGSANTEFSFLVEAAGLYAFRLTWEEGTSGANVEFYSRDVYTGVRTLINDPAVPTAIKAYRYCSAAAEQVTITQQPADVSTIANLRATFTVAASTPTITNPWLFAYQWQENGIDIPGANGPSYTTPLLTVADNGKTYRCQVILLGYRPVMSSAARLTVAPDVTAPTIVGVAGSASYTTVKVSYSEVVDPASAPNPANYTIAGLTIVGAAIDPTGTNVVLTTSTQAKGTPYTVRVSNVADLSGNLIAAGSTKTFTSYLEET